MAYLPQSEKDKEKEQGAAAPVLSSTSGVMPSMGMAAGASKAPTSSGAYSDVQEYLEANKGQGEKMAGQIAQGVENVAQSGEAGLKAAESEFGTQAAKSTPYQKLDFSDPTKVDPNAFKQQYGASYQGYQNLSDVGNYGNVMSMLGRAQTSGQLSQSEEGRKQLAAQQFQKPNYTGGMLSLDQAILQRTPAATEQFKAMKERTAQLPGYVDAAKQRAETVKTEKTAEAEKAKSEAQKGYADRLSQYNQQIYDKQQAAERSRPNRINEAIASYSRPGGIETPNLYNVKMADYMKDPTVMPTIGNIASAQEIEQAKALQSLAGQVDPGLFQGYGQGVLAGEKSERYDPSKPIEFDRGRFESDRASAGRAVRGELDAAMGRNDINAINSILDRYGLTDSYAKHLGGNYASGIDQVRWANSPEGQAVLNQVNNTIQNYQGFRI